MAKLLLVLKRFPHMTAVMWRRFWNITEEDFVIESHEISPEDVPDDLIRWGE